MAFVPLTPTTRGQPRVATTTTGLAMAANGNLMDRFSRVLRGSLNKAVSSIEDPEKVIVQAVNDMQVRKM